MPDKAHKLGGRRPPRLQKKKPNPRRRKVPAANKISRAEWNKIIQELPGYNPRDQAGDCKFSYAAAQHAVDFFETRLHHVKGAKARKPFLLERWQKALIGNLFGWKRPDKTRRYREAFIMIARKNGKTPLAAGIVLYMLLEDGEAGAELYGAGASHEQACFVFAHARGMVMQNERLMERCKILNGQGKAIEVPETFGLYKVIASDADTQHGQNASGAVADEVHAWKAGSDLLEILETAMAGRSQPLLFVITTSDYERPGAVWNAKYDWAVKVPRGLSKDR